MLREYTYLQCSCVHHLVTPKMAGASILLDIHCCSQVGRELMVDMNTQPDTEKDTSFTTTTTTTTTKNVRIIVLPSHSPGSTL